MGRKRKQPGAAAGGNGEQQNNANQQQNKGNNNNQQSTKQAKVHHPNTNNNANKGKKRKGKSKKKRPPPKLWVEDFKEAKSGKKGQLTGAITVVVSRNELMDDYMNPPNRSNAGASTEEANIEKEQSLPKEVCDSSASEGDKVRDIPKDEKKGEILNAENDSDGNSENDSSPIATTKKRRLEMDCKHPDELTSDGNAGSNDKPAEEVSWSPPADIMALVSAPRSTISRETNADSRPQDTEKSSPSSSSGSKEHESGSTLEETKADPCKETASNEPLADKHAKQQENDAQKSPSKTSKPDNRQPFVTCRRAPPSIGKLNWPKNKNDYSNLQNGDCGDGITNPFPSSLVADKYWAQRRRLFSRFDEGVKLDKESWYSVTPEAIADHIANRVSEMKVSSKKHTASNCEKEGIVVLDLFCGCGGNAISFGKLQSSEILLVVCVDADKEKLKMLAHNARIYGISAEKLLLINADAMFVMERCFSEGKLVSSALDASQNESKMETIDGYKIGGVSLLPSFVDVVFLSPPWGGTKYSFTGKGGFDLAMHIKIHSASQCKDSDEQAQDDSNDTVADGFRLLKVAASATKNNLVVYFLPRNINGVSVGRAALSAGYRGAIEMEQNVLNGKLKTVTVYLGKDCKELLAES